MFDPYNRDGASLGDAPAMNAIGVEIGVDLPVGVKGLRVYNQSEFAESITYITMTGEEVTFTYPPRSLTFEPLRIRQVMQATDAGFLIHGFTDAPSPVEP